MGEAAKTSSARETASQLRVAIGAFKRRARESQISPQAMGTTTASLEKLGLVARSADAADGRRSILHLTPEGLKAIGSGRNALVDRITIVLEE